MIYVVGQIWIWLLVAWALGALLAWLWLRFGAGDRVEEQVAPWKSRVGSLERERDALRRELGEARDRATESEAQLSALRDDLADRDARIEALAQENDGLKSEALVRNGRDGNGAVAPTSVAEPAAIEPVAGDDRNVPGEFRSGSNGSTTVPMTRINGIGTAMERRLNALGVTTVAQIAALTPDDIARIDSALRSSGRVEREDWVGQARALAEGRR